MAIKTYIIAQLRSGLCRAEIDVDDNTLRVRKGRVINGFSEPIVFRIKKSGNIVIEYVIEAGQSIERNLPALIQFAMDNGDPEWGYPPAMCMADIEIGLGDA